MRACIGSAVGLKICWSRNSGETGRRKNGSDGFSETLHVGSVFDDLSIDDVIDPNKSP